MKRHFVVLTITTLLSIPLLGCATHTGTGALTGGGLGAGLGAIIGHQSGHTTEGALIGGAAGALLGGAIGQSMDIEERRRLEAQSHATVVRIEQGQALSLADIKAMARAGLSDDTIINQIRNTRSVYRLSTSEIIELKDAGVSEVVINYMINTPHAAPPPPPSTTQQVIAVREPPPPPRREVIYVRPHPHSVWVDGYWAWHRGRWVWVGGHWVEPPHRHAVWIPPRYERRPHGHVYISGRWRID